MADQHKRTFGELTPDQCIDYAAGLLDGEERAEVLRLAAVSPESEELLRAVMAQAETARSSAAGRAAVRGSAADTAGLYGRFGRFLESMFGTGRLIPAMAGASLLILGLIVGAGTMHLLEPPGMEAGAPARLISLFPSATRTAGPAAPVSADTSLYVELNGIDYPCESPLLFNLEGPSGRTLLRGRLKCQPETGEWAGLFLPASLMAEAGDYRLNLEPDPSSPGDADAEQVTFRFSIR